MSRPDVIDATRKRAERSLAAEARFRAQLKELGAELLEPEWLGANAKHRIRCRAGHNCYLTPHGIRPGADICTACSGKRPDVAEAVFRAKLAQLGATPLFGKYLGGHSKHHVRCAKGHDCYPTPNHVLRGTGPCITCAGVDTRAAEAAFRARLQEMGAVVLFSEWNGVNARYHVQCPKGHDCYPRPSSVQAGYGICLICAGQDPATSEATFRARLARLGAQMLGPYVNSVTPVHVRCASGHDCYPRPAALNRRGRGICRACARFRTGVWDVFYVVTGGTTVKFGITCGDAKRRLRDHAREGYGNVVLLVKGLPGTVALDAEDAVKAALALAGAKPVRRWEYFDISCLGLILDVANPWLEADAA